MTTSRFHQIFPEKPLIGMVHLPPLPGAPSGRPMEEIKEAALEDMRALIRGGADGFIIENFGDVPYTTAIGPDSFAAMCGVAALLAAEATVPFGINVQFNCVREEWALDRAVGADFIRVEAFVESRAGSFGVTHGAAPELMRLRERLPADTMIFADVFSKGSYPLVDQPLDATVREAVACGADAVIVTGLATGKSPSLEEVRGIKSFAGATPVLLGSGIGVEIQRPPI